MSTQPADAANKASSNNFNRQSSSYSLAGAAARKTLKHCYPWALACSFLLSLMAGPPSAHGQTFSVLHAFTGGADGNTPVGVVRDATGNLYGVTLFGGIAGNGVVFKLNTTGEDTTVYDFKGQPDGDEPVGMIRDAAGNLYGTTSVGGAACNGNPGCGTVFKLDRNGNENVLHRFGRKGDGMFPSAGMIRDAAGNLYGTTLFGGALSCGGSGWGCGTIFKLDATGKESVLYRFRNEVDGENPNAVIRDAAGNLYGTTPVGGTNHNGIVFELDTAGKLTVLHTFAGGAEGSTPFGSLIRDTAGNLYGTTQYGGGPGSPVCQSLGCGTVFKLDTAGRMTVLYSFTGEADGGLPNAGLIRDAAGNLYGTTQQGGNLTCPWASEHGCGVVFKLDTTNQETVLYRFRGKDDGYWPYGLIRDASGNLYGTTAGGGTPTCLCGTVFKIEP